MGWGGVGKGGVSAVACVCVCVCTYRDVGVEFGALEEWRNERVAC